MSKVSWEFFIFHLFLLLPFVINTLSRIVYLKRHRMFGDQHIYIFILIDIQNILIAETSYLIFNLTQLFSSIIIV